MTNHDGPQLRAHAQSGCLSFLIKPMGIYSCLCKANALIGLFCKLNLAYTVNISVKRCFVYRMHDTA